MNYTKGQWKAELQGNLLQWQIKTDKENIAATNQTIVTDEGVREIEANAQLIAAAPDMYEALKTICEAFMCGEFDNAMRIAGTNGQQALSKAEGIC